MLIQNCSFTEPSELGTAIEGTQEDMDEEMGRLRSDAVIFENFGFDFDYNYGLFSIFSNLFRIHFHSPNEPANSPIQLSFARAPNFWPNRVQFPRSFLRRMKINSKKANMKMKKKREKRRKKDRTRRTNQHNTEEQ